MSLISLRRYDEALTMLGHIQIGHYRVAALTAACHARLADMDRARASVASCLAMRPDFSAGHFIKKEPFKNAEDAAHLAESLLIAGLPA